MKSVNAVKEVFNALENYPKVAIFADDVGDGLVKQVKEATKKKSKYVY